MHHSSLDYSVFPSLSLEVYLVNGKCSEDFEWMGSHANGVAITWPALLVMIAKPSPTLDMYPGPGLVADLQHSL